MMTSCPFFFLVLVVLDHWFGSSTVITKHFNGPRAHLQLHRIFTLILISLQIIHVRHAPMSLSFQIIHHRHPPISLSQNFHHPAPSSPTRSGAPLTSIKQRKSNENPVEIWRKLVVHLNLISGWACLRTSRSWSTTALNGPLTKQLCHHHLDEDRWRRIVLLIGCE